MRRWRLRKAESTRRSSNSFDGALLAIVAIAAMFITRDATAADLSVSISGDATAIAGHNYILFVSMETHGSEAASDVRLTIPIPEGVTFSGITRVFFSPGPDCANSAPGGSQSVVCTYASFSGSVQYLVQFAVDSSFPEGGSFNMLASVTATNDVTSANNSDAQQVTVTVGAADVSLSKRLIGVENVSPYPRLIYEVTATNLGPYDARGVAITDFARTGMSVETYTCERGERTGAPGYAQCFASLVEPQATVTMTVSMLVWSVADAPVNEATVRSLADPNGANDRAVASPAIEAVPLNAASLVILAIALLVSGVTVLNRLT